MSSSPEFSLESIVSEVVLPVIDFTKLPQELDDEEPSQLRDHPILAKLREACVEWGFFRLVNHGISVELLDKVQNVCGGLLSMPNEAKDRAATSNPFDSYIRTPNFETLNVLDTTQPEYLEQMCLRIWPEGNPTFCETMLKYNLCVTNLAQKVTKIIIASLGLDAKAFDHSLFGKCTSRLRINGFSSYQKNIDDEAMLAHTDSGCLTILYQDNNEGLEIRSREGKWFNVKPFSHSFVVNVGDSVKAWSNGRYRSSEHRVVCKGWIDRMSVGFFTVLPLETEIYAPAELVDESNPRRYKPFLYSEFREEIRRNREDRDKPNALERFARIY